jgi:hypothetical protein
MWNQPNQFQCDPEAASLVLTHPILSPKTVLVTLDLTHQVLGTAPVLGLINFGRNHQGSGPTSPSLVGQLFHEIMTFFSTTYADQFAMHSGPPLHDPVAVAAVLAPLIFDDNEGERFQIHVVREDVDDRDEKIRKERKKNGAWNQCGRTVLKMVPRGQPGIRVPRGVDVGVFWNLIEFALERADAVSREVRSAGFAPRHWVFWFRLELFIKEIVEEKIRKIGEEIWNWRLIRAFWYRNGSRNLCLGTTRCIRFVEFTY